MPLVQMPLAAIKITKCHKRDPWANWSQLLQWPIQRNLVSLNTVHSQPAPYIFRQEWMKGNVTLLAFWSKALEPLSLEGHNKIIKISSSVPQPIITSLPKNVMSCSRQSFFCKQSDRRLSLRGNNVKMWASWFQDWSTGGQISSAKWINTKKNSTILQHKLAKLLKSTDLCQQLTLEQPCIFISGSRPSSVLWYRGCRTIKQVKHNYNSCNRLIYTI